MKAAGVSMISRMILKISSAGRITGGLRGGLRVMLAVIPRQKLICVLTLGRKRWESLRDDWIAAETVLLSADIRMQVW